MKIHDFIEKISKQERGFVIKFSCTRENGISYTGDICPDIGVEKPICNFFEALDLANKLSQDKNYYNISICYADNLEKIDVEKYLLRFNENRPI